MSRKLFRLILLSLPFMILVSAIFAFTASNTVSESGIDDESHAITAEQLKPAACGDLPELVIIVTNNAYTYFNDLVLGTSGANTLNGGDGDDCLVGGDGNDTFDGGLGTNVCIGGGGDDNFSNCTTVIDP